MRNQKSFFVTLVLLFLLLNISCKQRAQESSDVSGLNINQSNIAVPRAIAFEEVELLKVLPNTHVPKGIFVPLTKYTFDAVKSLYQVIHKINRTEGLSGHD